MSRALARKLGWSSTIKTVFPMDVISRPWPSQIHTAGRIARAVTRTSGGRQPHPIDACQPPGLGFPALGAWRHVRNFIREEGSTMSTNAPEVRKEDRPGLERLSDRYEAVRQYSLAQILAVWAAAAVP